MPPSPNKFSRFLSFSTLLVLLASLVLVGINRLAIEDWFKLRGYQPSSGVMALANQDTMNDYTKHLFYLNKPQILGTVNGFRQACPENKDTIVLGCYHPGQNGIFIYNVPDPTLAGIQQVTAAHEALHAVYARLSDHDRTELNKQLQAFYKNGLTDQRVLAEVKIYQQTEPNDVLDEMSCTFGTELANLPAPLEAYYKRYFNNRSAIVAFKQQYEGEFTSRQNAIAADDQQLAAQKQQISAQESALNFQFNQINSDRARLDSLLSSGQTAAYNAAVPGFNNEINTYNNGYARLQAAISAYNQLVNERNQIAGQLTTLSKAIDTRLTPQAAP